MVKARRIALAVVTLLLVMAAVPQLASADSHVPFHARIVESVVSQVLCPVGSHPYVCVTVTGIGHATHLGAVTESMVVTVDLLSGAPACPLGGHTEVRRSTLTAANGDQITLGGPGYVCNGTLGIPHDAHDFWVVTNGTGRFDDAEGHGTDSVIIDQTNPNAVTSVTIFDGTLSLRGDR